MKPFASIMSRGSWVGLPLSLLNAHTAMFGLLLEMLHVDDGFT